MVAIKLGLRAVVRQGRGLVQVIPPMVLLFSMLTFLLAMELSVNKLVKPGITERTIRLGTVDGYPMVGSWYTLADLNRFAKIPGVFVGPANYIPCYNDPNAKYEFTCAVVTPTYLEAREEAASKEDIERWAPVKNGAIVVSAVAAKHHWNVGDSIRIFATRPGTPVPMDFVITSVLHNALTTDSVFIHSDYLERTFPKETPNFWVVWMLVDKPERRREVMDQIDADLTSIHRPHTLWTGEDTNALILGTGETLRRAFEIGGTFALVLVIALSVTLLIVSIERRKTEFAALRAIGFRRSVLAASIVVESFTLLLVSSCLGAFTMAALFHERAFRIDVVMTVKVPFSVAVMVALGGTLLGLLTATLPAWRLYRLDTLSALR